MKFTKKALFAVMQSYIDRKYDEKLKMLEQYLIKSTKHPENETTELFWHSKCKSEFNQRWKVSNYINGRFITNNEQWLLKSWSTFGDLCEHSKHESTS